jgi:hypothetical protein
VEVGPVCPLLVGPWTWLPSSVPGRVLSLWCWLCRFLGGGGTGHWVERLCDCEHLPVGTRVGALWL